MKIRNLHLVNKNGFFCYGCGRYDHYRPSLKDKFELKEKNSVII